MLAEQKAPFTWPITLGFIGLATLLTLAMGGLMAAGRLPITPELSFSEAGRQVVVNWIRLSLPVGILLPTVAFVVWFRHREIRRILGFYLFALVIQILSEQAFSMLWFSSLVVMVGNLYTLFRLWQLWKAHQEVKTWVRKGRDRLFQALLWLMTLFWIGNLILLLTLAWPAIAL